MKKLLPLLNVMLPLAFAWYVELVMDWNMKLPPTNGFFCIEPLKMYHILLYSLIIVSVATSFFLSKKDEDE